MRYWLVPTLAAMAAATPLVAAPAPSLAVLPGSTARPDADKARDADRKPVEVMAFAGVKPGDKIAELIPGGGYYTDVYFHSFFGFFPAYNPRFAILLYTNRPQGVQYASGTLTGTFMDMTNFLINYYNIPPDPGNVLPLPDHVTE